MSSAVLLVMAVPLALNKVRPNRLYGVRTKSTLRDPATWYRKNRRFGIALVVASVLYITAIGYPCARGIEVPRMLLLMGFLLEVGIPAFIALVPLNNHDRGQTK
jgi:hypothetical protein